MLFIVHAVDRTDALPTRLENYDAHKAFLSDTSRFGVKIVMSGPLVGDDNKTMIGSFFLVEAPSRRDGRSPIVLAMSRPSMNACSWGESSGAVGRPMLKTAR